MHLCGVSWLQEFEKKKKGSQASSLIHPAGIAVALDVKV